MAKREKTEYQLKVEELKAIIKTMKFDDVVKLRKNADGIIAGVLKSMLKSQRTQINKEIEKQNKRLEDVARLENELAPTDKKPAKPKAKK